MEGFRKILEKIARENNTTPQEVLDRMQQAVDLAYDQRNPDTQTLWDSMIFQEDRPTPEELVLQLALLLGVSAQSAQ